MMDQQDLTNRMTSPPRAFRILGPLKGLRHQLLAPLACQVILSQDKHDEIWVWLKFGTPIWVWSIWWIISLNGQLGINPISGITLHPDPGGEFPPWLNNLVLFPFQIGLVSKSPDALGALLSGGISRVEAPILSAKPCKATKRNRPWIFEAASSLRHRASLALSPPLDLAKKQPMQLVTIHHQGLIHGYGPWVMSPKKIWMGYSWQSGGSKTWFLIHTPQNPWKLSPWCCQSPRRCSCPLPLRELPLLALHDPVAAWIPDLFRGRFLLLDEDKTTCFPQKNWPLKPMQSSLNGDSDEHPVY